LRPYSPKLTALPRVARPVLRPLNCFLNLVRLGCSMAASAHSGPSGLRLRARRLGGFLFRLAEVEDLAAEDPYLHADHAVRRARFGEPVVDVRAERMQRDAALAIPLRACDLGTVQPARHLDLDALGPEPHRVRHGPPHRAPELHPALELLRDALGNQLRVELGLPDLRDVEPHVLERHPEQLRDVRAQLLDVLALLADNDARPRRVDRDVRALRRPLDVNAADGRVLELLLQELADPMVLLDVHGERLRIRVPLRQPLAGDAEANSGRMYFLTHGLLVRHSNRDVAVALQDSVAPTLRPGAIAGKERRAVDLDDGDLELVDVRTVIVLGVCDRGLEHLVHDTRGLLAAEPQDVDGLPDGLAPDLISDEAAFLRRNARISQCRRNLHRSLLQVLARCCEGGCRTPFFRGGRRRSLPPRRKKAVGHPLSKHPTNPYFDFRSPECPLNVRVIANSPSLWPTMFSEISTGTC